MAQPTAHVEELDANLIRPVNYTDAWRVVTEYALLNGTGSNNLAVDGSGGSPQVFSYTPPVNYDFIWNRTIFYLQAVTAMSPENFGDLVALGTGVKFVVNGVLITTWQDNIDIYTEMYNISGIANISDVDADTTVNGRWSLTRDTNSRGVLVPNGKLVEVIVNDALDGLTAFRVKIKGQLIAAK